MISSAARLQQQSSIRSFRGWVGDHHLLRPGASGTEVKQLQRALNTAGVRVPVTGQFDGRTEQAVRDYQRAKGLQVDGVVGQQTWGSFLGKSYPPGTHMLAGAPAQRPSRPGNTSPVQGPTDSFEAGPGKRVTAYVNGQARSITVVPVGGGEYMRADAARAFVAMQAAARRAGISIGATSGFRTMAEQQDLYRRYLNGTGNLAARPGYSNHQNGIAMDISGVGGRGTAADRWLRANAARFGFRNLPSEFWHYDFVG